MTRCTSLFLLCTIFLLVCTLKPCRAFLTPTTTTTTTSFTATRVLPHTITTKSLSRPLRKEASSSRWGSTGRGVVLAATTKKNSSVKKDEEKKELKWYKLILAYATPWRNPNSIFVYLFLIVFLLGKMSEARNGGGGGG